MILYIVIDFCVVGLIGGLLSIFYRNCLKPQNMIFRPFYESVLLPMYFSHNKIYKFLSLPLGVSTYCTNFWITAILLIVYLSSWEILPKWQDITLGIIAAEGFSHLIVSIIYKFIIRHNIDLDNYHEDLV